MKRNTLIDGATNATTTDENVEQHEQKFPDQQEQTTDVRHGVSPDPITAFVQKATKQPEETKLKQVSASLPEKYTLMFDRYFSKKGSKTDFIKNAVDAFLAKDGMSIGADGELQYTLSFPVQDWHTDG